MTFPAYIISQENTTGTFQLDDPVCNETLKKYVFNLTFTMTAVSIYDNVILIFIIPIDHAEINHIIKLVRHMLHTKF